MLETIEQKTNEFGKKYVAPITKLVDREGRFPKEAYDAKVVPIWDIIRDYSNAYGYKLDYVLFSNYERQVEHLLKGYIDIAWNTNVAWIRTLYATNHTAKAIIMRDTDIDFTTKFITKKRKWHKKYRRFKG